jgi:uncharacterized membrane protein YidH (DUF202 family)
VSASGKTYFDMVNTRDEAAKTGLLIWIIVGVGAVVGFIIIIGLFIYFRRKAKMMPDE